MSLDFSSILHYVVALAPECVLSVAAMGILVHGSGSKRRSDGSAGIDPGWIALGGVGLAAGFNGWLYSMVGGADANAIIAIDAFRLYANWILLLGGALTLLVSIQYARTQRFAGTEYYALILFALVGMMFMAAARDLMVIFLALELMSIGVYALAGFNRRDKRSAEAGLKYFLLGAFASGFLLFGIALLYGATGSVGLSAIAEAIGSGAAHRALLLPGVALLAVGFAFKVALVPFHMWTPDVYEGAPYPVTAFMAAAVKTAGFIAFARVFATGLLPAQEVWSSLIWGLSAATMVVGNVLALAQKSVKRMLAYSSIAHGGYLLVGVAAMNERAMGGMLLYLLAYTVMTVAAFAAVAMVDLQRERGAPIEAYAGLGVRHPIFCVFLTVLLLSLGGFPGTGAFWGKVYLLMGAVEADLVGLAVILGVGTVISYWYYLRVAWYMWMKGPDSTQPQGRISMPLAAQLVLALSTGIILLLFIFPGWALDMVQESILGVGAAQGDVRAP